MCHDKNKNTPTKVIRIVPQQRAPVERSQQNAGFRPLCATKGHRGELCPIFLLQVRLTLLKQRENNKCNFSYERSLSSSWGRSPKYLVPIDTFYRYSINPTVVQGVNSSGTVYQAEFSSSRPTHKT